MITEEMIPALQGTFPNCLNTVDSHGIPNTSYISQVSYIDDEHVAISNQFLNKSMKNIRATKKVSVNVISPENFDSWYLHLDYVRSETEGDLFEDMSMKLEVIASMSGMEDVFKLQAAEVFKVIKVSKFNFGE